MMMNFTEFANKRPGHHDHGERLHKEVRDRALKTGRKGTAESEGETEREGRVTQAANIF